MQPIRLICATFTMYRKNAEKGETPLTIQDKPSVEHASAPLEPVALVTGTSSGFGLLTCLALAKDGYRVVATMRNIDKKSKLIMAAEKWDVRQQIEIMEMDVTREKQVYQVIGDVMDKWRRIDVLVNNAGYAAGGVVEEVSLADWRQQFETNVFGAIASTQAVLPHMRKQGFGTIVSVSSVSGRLAMPGLGPYSASKFALEGLMESLRFEVARYGIHVALVEPGPYRTNVWDNSLRGYELNPESPYIHMNDRLYRQVQHTARTAGDPMEVVHLIQKVIQTGAPNFRYPVGKGIGIALAARRWLP